MKQWMVILLAAAAGLAQAQSFDWNRVWASCSSEARAFDAVAANSGSTTSRVKAYVEDVTGRPPTAASLRAKMEEDRRLLGERLPVEAELATKLALCGTLAAQRLLASGSTQSASSAPSRPSPPPPSSRGNSRNQPDKVAVHCLDEVGSGAMRNTCNQQVSVRWCSMDYGANACGSGNMGWADVPPGGAAALPRDVRVQLIACAAPTRPTDIQYTPGSGFLYNCSE